MDKTVTVGPSQTYASLSAALAAEAADLTSASYYNGGPGRLIVECYDFEDTTAVDTAGQSWTTSTDYYVLIKAVDDHGGKWSTSSYRLVTSNVTALTNSTIDHLHLQGLQINPGSAADISGIRWPVGLDAGFQKVEKCIIVNDGTSGTAYGVRVDDGSPTYYVWNSVLYCGSPGGSSRGVFHYTVSTPSIYVYNCTIDGYAYAALLNGSISAETNLLLKNTRATGITSSVVSASGGGTLNSASDYNLTDSAAPTNWGSNSIDSTDSPTIDYVDDSNATLTSRDYHLGATDSGIGAGTDLSSDGSLAFSDDIDGETRG